MQKNILLVNEYYFLPSKHKFCIVNKHNIVKYAVSSTKVIIYVVENVNQFKTGYPCAENGSWSIYSLNWNSNLIRSKLDFTATLQNLKDSSTIYSMQTMTVNFLYKYKWSDFKSVSIFISPNVK